MVVRKEAGEVKGVHIYEESEVKAFEGCRPRPEGRRGPDNYGGVMERC